MSRFGSVISKAKALVDDYPLSTFLIVALLAPLIVWVGYYLLIVAYYLFYALLAFLIICCLTGIFGLPPGGYVFLYLEQKRVEHLRKNELKKEQEELEKAEKELEQAKERRRLDSLIIKPFSYYDSLRDLEKQKEKLVNSNSDKKNK